MLSTRARRLAAVMSVAILGAAAAIAVSASSAPETSSAAVRPAAADLAGIPERRGVLGDPKAPLTLTEFVDPQCPVCAAAAREVLPAILDDYVRTGRVKLDARVLSFLGPDSVTAARYASAAREQDKLWPFLETLYANQGAENSGYVTEGFLARIARAAGLDDSTASAFATTPASDTDIDHANAEAQRLGVTGTPTFVLTDRAGRERIVPVDRLATELGR